MDLRGAAPDRSCFYSTSLSISQEDWLPTLRSKFKLHLSTGKEKATPKLPALSKRKESGYTKNHISFVNYDPAVDERDIK